MQNPDNLRVMGESRLLAIEVYRVTGGFPSTERFGLTAPCVAPQSRWAQTSPRDVDASVIASSFNFSRSRSAPATELEFQAQIATDLTMLNEADVASVQERIGTVKRMLSGLIKSHRSRASNVVAEGGLGLRQRDRTRPQTRLQSRSHDLTVSRSHGLTVSRSHGLTVSRSHGLTVSRSHGLTVSRSHEFSRSHGLPVSRSPGLPVSRSPRSPGLPVSRSPGLTVSRSHGLTLLQCPTAPASRSRGSAAPYRVPVFGSTAIECAVPWPPPSRTWAPIACSAATVASASRRARATSTSGSHWWWKRGAFTASCEAHAEIDEVRAPPAAPC